MLFSYENNGPPYTGKRGHVVVVVPVKAGLLSTEGLRDPFIRNQMV